MKRFTLLLLLVMLLVPAPGAAQEKSKLSIANLEWLPYSGKFLEGHGIALEIITAVFRSMGVEVEYSFMSWTQTLEEVKNGNYDAVATAYHTDERAQIYQFTEPYLESPIVFFKRKESDISWSGNLKELSAYKIGIVKGYANSPEFDSATYLNKVVSTNEALLLRKIIYNQADLIVLDKFAGIYNIKDKLFGADTRKLEPINPPLIMNQLYMMFSRKKPGHQEKAELFNRGLQKIRNNGTYDRIISKYGL